MCCCECIDKCFNTINKLFNGILALLGLGVTGYGVYLLSVTGWVVGPFNITVIGIGAVLAMLASVYVLGGHKSSCFLLIYVCLMGILMIGSASAALMFLFFQHEQFVKFLEKNLPKDVRPDFDSDLTVRVAGYVCAGLAAVQLLSLSIAHLHRGFLKPNGNSDIGDEEDDYDGESLRSGLLSSNSRSTTRETEIPSSSGSGTDANDAKSRYRTKYADLYEKYNISTSDP